MIETLAHWYSSENTHQELSNEYQHDRVKMFFKNLGILMLCGKLVAALEGLIFLPQKAVIPVHSCSNPALAQRKCVSSSDSVVNRSDVVCLPWFSSFDYMLC